MRTTATALFACFLICCGAPVPKPVEPEYARSYYKTLEVPPPVFASMDLPYYGGKIERVTETYMQVSYGREATVDQLREWWPEAVKAEGWVPTREDQDPTGGFSGIYTTPDGRGATLIISPTGMLWMVDITIR